VNEFQLAADDEALAYLREIAAAMGELFAVAPAEAAGRIADFWAGQSFRTAEQNGALFHQRPQTWAKAIYYGRRDWWVDEASLSPAPYPRA
jgi:hypothetical protein